MNINEQTFAMTSVLLLLCVYGGCFAKVFFFLNKKSIEFDSGVSRQDKYIHAFMQPLRFIVISPSLCHFSQTYFTNFMCERKRGTRYVHLKQKLYSISENNAIQ